MKKFAIIITAILLISKTQAQDWLWAISCGKSIGDDLGRIVIDNNSNLYLAATIYQPFGYFGNDTIVTNGVSDIVFAKLNSSGNFQWVQQIGGNNSTSFIEATGGINYNSTTNSIYLTGMFYDSITLGSTTIHSGGSNDIFFAKYDVNGNCEWAKKAGSNNVDLTVNITSDNNGNLYTIGNVNDTAYFDSYVVPKGTFLAKYNSSGTCQWAKKIISGANLNGISCYNNEILIAGNTTNDTIIIDTDTLFSTISADLIIAKFDTNGSLIWSKLDATGTVAYVPDIKFDSSGNFYVTGIVAGFDSIKFGNIVFPPSGFEVFLVKYDYSGTVIWAKLSQCSSVVGVFDLAVNSGDGSVYLTGRFEGTITFNTYTVTTAATSNVDMFLIRYNANGDCLGIRNTQVDLNGPNPGRGYSLAQNSNSTCYVAGQFRNTANFGSYSVTSVSQKDIFIAKIDAITGIGEVNRTAGNQLLIYANPNQGKCTITVPEEFKNEKNLTLRIFDNTGKMLQQQTLQMNDGKIKVNLEAEAKGVYNITLSNSSKSYSGKIVFE